MNKVELDKLWVKVSANKDLTIEEVKFIYKAIRTAVLKQRFK